MVESKQFTVGDKLPTWFAEQTKLGRAKANYDEEDESLVSITVHTPTKTYTANLGDIVIMSKNGMAVIKKKETIVKKGE